MYLKILKNIAGITLIGIGIIGLFLPILQGVLMIIAGLLLLGIKREQIKEWFKKLKF
ncbi:MAG: PGPGW domain-containing protein [Nanoarchaeota archaeon]|nr:PGPGW domain-containing protein [Nanoarchaeota archaeon]